MYPNFSTYLTHKPEVQAFFDIQTNTISYVVADPATATCAIIDSVLDFKSDENRITYESADALIAYITEKGYTVSWILETHVHADHLSAGFYLKEKLSGKLAMSAHITDVQSVFGAMFGEGKDFARDGSQFDALFDDGDTFTIGNIPVCVLNTPGHTPADVAYVIGDSVFVGDTLFMPDYGSARCDFPGGSAEQLYASVQKIFTLPETTRMFLCHDYLPEGRSAYEWETTVGAQKHQNIHLKAGTDPQRFMTMRSTRDATLGLPRLIVPSIQVNMRAGRFTPHPETGNPILKSLDPSSFKKLKS